MTTIDRLRCRQAPQAKKFWILTILKFVPFFFPFLSFHSISTLKTFVLVLTKGRRSAPLATGLVEIYFIKYPLSPLYIETHIYIPFIILLILWRSTWISSALVFPRATDIKWFFPKKIRDNGLKSFRTFNKADISNVRDKHKKRYK